MDIKNVSDYFKRQSVAGCLTERKVFHFITDSEGSMDEDAMTTFLTKAMEEMEANGPEAEEEAVENEVFRQQFIPQTLEQVYDVERDAELVNEGGQDDLVYRDLLVNKKDEKKLDVKKEDGSEDGEEEEEDDDEDENSQDDEGESSVDEADFEKTPKGKKFEDKDAKKVSFALYDTSQNNNNNVKLFIFTDKSLGA